MSDKERAEKIAAMQAKRAAQGMAHPLNRLVAYCSTHPPIVGKDA